MYLSHRGSNGTLYDCHVGMHTYFPETFRHLQHKLCRPVKRTFYTRPLMAVYRVYGADNLMLVVIYTYQLPLKPPYICNITFVSYAYWTNFHTGTQLAIYNYMALILDTSSHITRTSFPKTTAHLQPNLCNVCL